MKQIMKQSMQQVIKNQQGFTLVELMIVVAIIGILAAIAVPQFMSYRTRSYNAGAKAVAHNLKADQSNLNAELGVYGHTEAAAATLAAAPAAASGVAVAGAVADTGAVAGLAVPATAAVAGARLAGDNAAGTRQLAVPISLGTQMAAQVLSIQNAADQSNFHLFTRHIKGDTAYALDNDVENTVYTVSNPLWPSLAGIQCTIVNPAVAPAADIAAVAGGGAPTLNWTVLP